MRTNFGSHNTRLGIIAVIVGIVFVVGIGFTIFSSAHTETFESCTVSDKTATSGHGEDKKTEYRIYTDECGTFTTKDSLLDWNWSSSDVYGSIKVGEKYTFETRGIRIPIFSSFQNISEATKL